MTEHAKEVMKKCQIGFGNYPNALQDANNLLAECYGTIGKLSAEIAELKEQLKANEMEVRPSRDGVFLVSLFNYKDRTFLHNVPIVSCSKFWLYGDCKSHYVTSIHEFISDKPEL